MPETQLLTKIKIAARVATLLACLALFPESVLAAGDAERGKTLSYTCLGCHGIEGYRNAYPSFRVPKLGGQKAEYIVAALQGYRDGLRRSFAKRPLRLIRYSPVFYADNFRFASCCSVLVVNGGRGRSVNGLTSTLLT